MDKNPGKIIYVSVPHAGRYQLDTLLKEVKILRKSIWTYKVWTPTPALIDKSSRSSTQFVGQRFDKKYFDLDETGWTHDHCELCFKRISNIEGYGDTDGYECSLGWICKDCYKIFIEPKDIDSIIAGLVLTE